jgi:hypothetical protein
MYGASRGSSDDFGLRDLPELDMGRNPSSSGVSAGFALEEAEMFSLIGGGGGAGVVSIAFIDPVGVTPWLFALCMCRTKRNDVEGRSKEDMLGR